MARLYQEFMQKLKVAKVNTQAKEIEDKEIVITIPLKGGASVSILSSYNFQQAAELDDKFLKVIQYEYSVRYLEVIGIEPNSKNIANLLKHAPLSSCEFQAGWNNNGWLADMLYIYPNKQKKNNFDQNRETFLAMKG